MLEKMGWSEGNGLGAAGHGIKAHLKVSRKNNALGLLETSVLCAQCDLRPTAGIGAKNDYDYEWLKTRDMYNNLLADLNVDLANTAAPADMASKEHQVMRLIRILSANLTP